MENILHNLLFSFYCWKAQWREREWRGTGIQGNTISWEGRQLILHLSALLLRFYHEVVVLIGSLSNRISFPEISEKPSQDRCPLPFQSKENDAWFYWNQPRVVFIIENIQYFWTSHKKPSRYICSSSKCSIDNLCAACSTILIMQTSSSHYDFYSASLFYFLNPENMFCCPSPPQSS